MPITDRSQAKDGGFAQVRASLIEFEGDVTSAVFDKWGGQLVDEAGKKLPAREFLEIACENVEVHEVSEELTMDISEQYTFRENCSDFKGSFWVEMFLASADKFKLLIPDGLVSKRITFRKETLEAEDPKYNSTNYVIMGVKEIGKAKPKVVAAEHPLKKDATVEVATDPMMIVADLAVGKTEDELKAAIPTHPALKGSPMLPLAQAGMITQALINEGKIVLVEGKYQKSG